MFFLNTKFIKEILFYIYEKIFLGAPGAGKGTAASRIAPIKTFRIFLQGIYLETI